MSDKRRIKVFIASPSDLAIERRAFKDQVDLLNLGFGDGAGVEFVPVGWEEALGAAHRTRHPGHFARGFGDGL